MALFKGAVKVKLTIDQMAILGVNSLSIVILTTAFAGMVVSLEIAQLAVKYGIAGFVGGGVAIAMAREFAPMLTAIVVAGRAGSAITAEIGSMKVTEQIDALQAMAVSPVKYLVVPRFLACLAMIPLLTVFANLCGVSGGALIAYKTANIAPRIFFDSVRNIVDMHDFWGGIYKAGVFAAEIALISCYQGLNTSGGAAGVGKATTGSVVYSMILIFLSNYFLSIWLFK
ncbi:MAG: ABC transporter permease [Armatimonadetes bacterium]|nr:ABC transporter permease [Armatimonadota bacterium]